jgi:hypothetical protein
MMVEILLMVAAEIPSVNDRCCTSALRDKPNYGQSLQERFLDK